MGGTGQGDLRRRLIILRDINAKTPARAHVRGFLFLHLDNSKGEHVIDFSKLIRELREMAEKLPNWKFLLIWSVLLILSVGYFIGQIRWW